MRIVKCYECGKRYNYDEDGFCPKCGCFNQPLSLSRIGADGSVVWADGLNERNHTGSFAHKELHDEEKNRRKRGLDRDLEKRAVLQSEARNRSVHTARTIYTGSEKKKTLSPVVVLILVILFVNFVFPLLGTFFSMF